MKMELKEAPKKVQLNGVDYIRIDIHESAFNNDELPYCIVRAADAGVHIGYLQFRDGNEVHLVDSRRIFYWEGAATLSQMARDGVSKPDACKIPCSLPFITIIGVCEIIPATKKCMESITAVPVWSE